VGVYKLMERMSMIKSAIPVNVALGVESCLAACGLKKKSLEVSRVVLKRGLGKRTVGPNKGWG
jgi:hypothetical protein